MEIKILCDCGTKFKFDVEPVNARMPAPANCPACGADATPKANTFIQSALSAAPAQSIPAPGGLRINRPSASSAHPGGDEAPPPPIAPLPPTPIRQNKEKSPLVKVLTTVLLALCIGFGAWRFGVKWFKRLNLVATIASAVGEGSVDSGESEGARNLWYENCAILFVKHTNHLEVAEACKDFWKVKLHKNLTLIDSPEEVQNAGEYELISAHNGYVRILGAHEWPAAQHEALAQHLSQKFAGLVFEWRSESFADTYHFGVYDQGAKKFHAQMDVKITQDNADEIVTTEGNEFAIANGYKPGAQGFKEFHVLDADKITQQLGMKLWDEKDGTEMKGMLLKETGPVTGGG